MLFLITNIDMYIHGAIQGLFATICEFVYTIMAWTWSLLLDVSKIRLLNSGKCSILEFTEKIYCQAAGGTWTDSMITMIYKRFTLLLGIIMTFFIIFQFIKYIMTPEEIEDKEKGIEKLGFKLLIVVTLLALTPTIFDKAYELQSVVVENQVLSKLILGRNNMQGMEFGKSFSASLLSNFYYVEGHPNSFDNNNQLVESGLNCGSADCTYIVQSVLGNFRQNGKLSGLNTQITEHGEIEGTDTYYIHFDGLFAVAVGIFITYMLIMYTIDVGARVIQLTFLQVIAPIPIITYLSPKKDGTFQKWTKQCWVTYLDLFIRLGILYFTTLLLEVINETYKAGTWGNTGTNASFFIYLVLILGLMMFCKRAPKMVEELFPSLGTASGTFGLKPGERITESARRVTGAAVAGAAGAVIGLGTGIVQGARARKRGVGKGVGRATEGAIIGAIGGMTRGLYNGSKKGNMIKNIGAGIKNQTDANRRFGNRAESGYKWSDQIGDSARQAFKMPTRVEEIEKEKAPLKAIQEAYNGFAKTNDSIREHAFKKAQDNGLKSYVEYAAAEGRHKRLQEDRQYINAFVDKDSNGKVTARGEQSQAYKNAMSDAVQDMKKYKDAAINEYINLKAVRDANNHIVKYDDGRLDGLMKERDQNLTNYNEYASEKYKISETIKIKKADGSTETKFIKDLTAEEYDEYVKKVANDNANNANRAISALEAEEQDIKGTIEGSGIPGGKK